MVPACVHVVVLLDASFPAESYVVSVEDERRVFGVTGYSLARVQGDLAWDVLVSREEYVAQ